MSTQHLTECDKEAIHKLSRIQQSGTLFVLGYDEYKILQISDNCFSLLKQTPKEVLNRPIRDFFGETFAQKIHQLTETLQTNKAPLTLKYEYSNKNLFCVLHLELEFVILEVTIADTPLLKLGMQPEDIIERAIKHCESALNFEQLMQAIANSVQTISGYDRVLLYKFDEDSHGTVLAEANQKFDESFLFHRFPASDIPTQARELYLNNRFRIIENVGEENANILPSKNPITTEILDMSKCYLRGVSQVHIEYLKNMGVKSSMSISIVIDGKLWGLVACHHTKTKSIPLWLYRSYYLMSDIFSAQIQQKELFVKYSQRAERQLHRELFTNLLNARTYQTFYDALACEITRLELVIPSDECIVFEDDAIICKQSILLDDEILQLHKFGLQNINDNIYYTSHLGLEFETANDFSKIVGGILFAKVPLEEKNIYVMFLRYELVYNIHWAGNPNKQVEYINGLPIINPRASFESYKEIVRGTSNRFLDVDIDSATTSMQKLANSFLLFQSFEEIHRVKEEKRVLQEQKLNSMVELISNISHQWRQPLSIISSIASGTKFQQELSVLDGDILIEDMDTIVKQTQYLSKTIDDFRNFLKNTNCRAYFTAIDTIQKALTLMQPLLQDIHLITDFEEDMKIYGYENEFIQSLINLINNAKDAIEIKQPKVISIKTHTKNEMFCIEIFDNGGGISQDIINRIFEPYFTTKHQSIGTGLGLSLAYQMLTRHHNAQIEVNNKTFTFENMKYTGACFRIFFIKEA